jgi:PAS domain-containing protein
LRKSDIAADCGSRDPLASLQYQDMSSSFGFWSLDPSAGVLTCCPRATEILGISGGSSLILREVLLRLHAPDRRRLLRAGFASLKRRSTFDIVALIRAAEGVRLLRVIGGAGYEAARRDAQMHGVVEQIALESF